MGKGSLISVIVGVILIGLVLGISSFNEQAQAGGTIGGCDSFGENEIQHWDKIIFKVDQRLINSFPSPAFPAILKPILTYDIKVPQDPISVTALEKTVSKFLTDFDYRTLAGKKVSAVSITIVDVEYEIACVFTGLGGF